MKKLAFSLPQTSVFRTTVAMAAGAVAVALATPALAKDTGEFTAPTGPEGAGLREDGSVRAYGEFGFHTQGVQGPFGSASFLYLNWLFGLGIHVSDNVEIEVQLPTAHSVQSTNALSTDQAAFGNLGVGANWFKDTDFGLWKVGGLVTFGPWNDNASLSQQLTLAAASSTRGAQDTHLWVWNRVGLVVASTRGARAGAPIHG